MGIYQKVSYTNEMKSNSNGELPSQNLLLRMPNKLHECTVGGEFISSVRSLERGYCQDRIVDAINILNEIFVSLHLNGWEKGLCEPAVESDDERLVHLQI